MTLSAWQADVVNILSRLDERHHGEKSLLQQVSQPPKQFFLTTLLVMVWAIVLMVMGAMLVVRLPDPILWAQHVYQASAYSFQVPAVLLAAAVLGCRFGGLTMLLYLALGLGGLPIFAGGGGLDYLYGPTAGYLLGFLFVPAILHRCLIRAYRDSGWFRGRSLWLLLGTVLAVVVIHAAGLAGLAIHCLLGKLTWLQAQHWLTQLSWPALAYDILFGWIVVGITRFCRILFWFCLY